MTILRVEKSNPAYSPACLDYLTLYSSHLGGRHDISVYGAHEQGQPLPIVVLMHGVYRNHWVWKSLGGVDLVYEKLRQQGLGAFILVMPSDGGFMDGSGYLPLVDGDYERWIMDDVVTGVKQHCAGADACSKVYLSGLSMGGYGALRLGAKYAKQVAGISAHSSIITLPDFDLFVDIQNQAALSANLDQYHGEILPWLNENQGFLPPLRFDCGTDDSLYASNVAFANDLTTRGIEHQFEALTGAHSWDYWHNNVERSLRFFHQLHYANKPLVEPNFPV